MIEPSMICIYKNILEQENEVKVIRLSEEAATALVLGGEREIWVRLQQLTPTDKKEEAAAAAPPKEKRWTWGEQPPEHLIKPKTRRKRK